MGISNGRLSVAAAANLAVARVAEGGADSNTEALASCKGSQAERDLHSWVQQQPWRGVLPQLYGFEAPMMKRGHRVAGIAYCLLPHEVFGSLSAHAPMVFQELFGAPEDREHYWQQMARTAEQVATGPRALEHKLWLEGHPSQWAKPCNRIPLGMHGDGGQMHGGEKVMVVSWGGLCRKGSTLDTRLLFTVLKDSEQDHEGHATLYKAFQVLAWSFKALVTGVYPAHDEQGQVFGPGHDPARAAMAGKPLALGNLCGAWCELRGDWQFLREALNLKHHYGAREMCHLCAAQNSPGNLSYENFSAAGVLRTTLVGPRDHGWVQWEAKEPASPLLEIPGFSIWRCNFDLMHTLELGLLQRVIPAALQGLMGLVSRAEASVWPGRSKAARCVAATEAYHSWVRARGVGASTRVKKITPRWVSGQWPVISQEHAKAAALRAMLPWVVELSGSRAAASHMAQLRHKCLRGLAAMDAVYAQQPRLLSCSQEETASAHCLSALAALAELTRLSPEGPWRLIPKAHALMHIACDSCMGNPRVAHCYQDEDFIGRVKRLYVACHGKTAPQRALQRYALGTALGLRAREQLACGKRLKRGATRAGGPMRRRADGAAAGSADASSGLKRPRGRPPVLKAKRPRGRPPRHST